MRLRPAGRREVGARGRRFRCALRLRVEHRCHDDLARRADAEGLAGQDCPADAGPDDGEYGKLKAGCERAVTELLGDRSTVARAGLILGPHENVGRLPAWLMRIARGGEVLAPGDPGVATQLVDVRDLARFLLDCGERRTAGTFNATAPPASSTYGELLDACVEVTGSGATLTWVPDDLLVEHEVEPWTELPLWMPPGQDGDAVWQAATDRTEAAGMRVRPLRETVADTWAWLEPLVRSGEGVPALPDRDYVQANGIDPAKETRILAAWHALVP